jgi:hypothetical protein
MHAPWRMMESFGNKIDGLGCSKNRKESTDNGLTGTSDNAVAGELRGRCALRHKPSCVRVPDDSDGGQDSVTTSAFFVIHRGFPHNGTHSNDWFSHSNSQGWRGDGL